MTVPVEIEELGMYRATFSPATERQNDLKVGLADWIGYRGIFRAGFQLGPEDLGGRYEGQYAMLPIERPDDAIPLEGHWAPEEDLRDVEEVDRLEIDW